MDWTGELTGPETKGDAQWTFTSNRHTWHARDAAAAAAKSAEVKKHWCETQWSEYSGGKYAQCTPCNVNDDCDPGRACHGSAFCTEKGGTSIPCGDDSDDKCKGGSGGDEGWDKACASTSGFPGFASWKADKIWSPINARSVEFKYNPVRGAGACACPCTCPGRTVHMHTPPRQPPSHLV